ncbi:MAG: class I poly(R)-hydroxyalkanoic acid synthase [Alphaproteobacteria bacterium]|nr:class I poly(R)-hydroxyalkanoic acid synthase [Alphaproteobacteria bacterium]
MEQKLAEQTPRAAQPAQKQQPKQSETDNTLDEAVDGALAKRMSDPLAWSQILMHVTERCQEILMSYIQRHKEHPIPLPQQFTPTKLLDAFIELNSRILNDPKQFVDTQLALWQGYTQIWQSALARMQGKTVSDYVNAPVFDRRFKDKEWQQNWIFDYLKQLYLLTSQKMYGWVKEESSKLDPTLARKVEFYTRQMGDALAPSNFWMTNPEVLRAMFQSNGESLIKGFENFIGDLERGHGELRISMTDATAFSIGDNIAMTPGRIVYQNQLMQLIQYAPQTSDVYAVPVLIIPPWINKFYILDLRENNSLIRYLLNQGFTVFCVSWVNPDAKLALTNFDDYMVDGPLAALREIKRITGAAEVNAVGYCIGGTLLASTLGWLAAQPAPATDLTTVKSATYFVTLVDFSDPGDIGVFIDDDLIKYVEDKMARQGYMDAATMATVFNLLRSNDLIWSYVVNNYLLGKDPAPFDILYWNSDSTNLPAVMQSYYLRNMYLLNRLRMPGGITLKGTPVDVRKIQTPTYLLSTRDDHIAPWRTTYQATQLYSGNVTFTLAGSGHIAGVINPPSVNKYGYWTNETCPSEPEQWLKAAEEHKGSWWPHWANWLGQYGGEKVPPRQPPEGLEPAPGSYVKVRAV